MNKYDDLQAISAKGIEVRDQEERIKQRGETRKFQQVPSYSITTQSRLLRTLFSIATTL